MCMYIYMPVLTIILQQYYFSAIIKIIVTKKDREYQFRQLHVLF